MSQVFLRVLRVSLACLVVTLASAAHAQLPQGKPVADPAKLVRGNLPGEWRYWGGDAWSTRYSPLDQINASNFDSLQVA